MDSSKLFFEEVRKDLEKCLELRIESKEGDNMLDKTADVLVSKLVTLAEVPKSICQVEPDKRTSLTMFDSALNDGAKLCLKDLIKLHLIHSIEHRRSLAGLLSFWLHLFDDLQDENIDSKDERLKSQSVIAFDSSGYLPNMFFVFLEMLSKLVETDVEACKSILSAPQKAFQNEEQFQSIAKRASLYYNRFHTLCVSPVHTAKKEEDDQEKADFIPVAVGASLFTKAPLCAACLLNENKQIKID